MPPNPTMPVRTCRHLAAFRIDVATLDPTAAGSPPWLAVCEDCSASVVAALRESMERIDKVRPRPSGKSNRAVSWARFRRLLLDLGCDVSPRAEEDK